MPFSLCNAPGTFQRCMMAMFMDDFSVFGSSFSTCLTHLEKMLKRCEDTNLALNWEKSHFMVKEGIILGHKISKSGIEVWKRITKKRTKNKAKTTKPDTEWKSCEEQSQIKAKDQKSQSQSQLNKLTVKTGAVIEEYYW
ncbi:reverse transcriptase domain-containing protein, partial [Tanacetum coccineum]